MKNVIRDLFPITHAQKRIWYSEQIYPGTSASTLAFTIKYQRLLDYSLLDEAISLVLRRNDGLRLRISAGQELSPAPINQYVGDYAPVQLPYFDFAASGIEAESTWLERETRKPFELMDSSLYYFAAVRFSDGMSGYYMKLHHLISDGRSLFLLFNEIDRIYMQLEQGEEPDPAPNNSYLDYINDEKAYLESEQFQKDRNFWLEKMLPLPEKAELTFSSNKGDNIACGCKVLKLEPGLRDSLHAFCRQKHTSIFKVCMAALTIYIARAARNRDVVIGMANHNRVRADHQTMIGMFVSTFPLRILVDEDLSFQQLLEQVGSDISFIIKNHSQYPFDQLAAELRAAAGLDPGYLLDINLVGNPDVGKPGIELDFQSPGSDPAALTIQINPNSRNERGFLEMNWYYQEAVFSPEYIDTMQKSLVNILTAALENPDCQIASIELVDPEEKQRLLHNFNDTGRDYPTDPTIQALFERQVERFRHKPALVFKGQRLSYGKLNARANQLARLLRERGVGPDRIVGIMLEPCLEMLTGILGVLKAGGAFLPIDPAYPAERIQYMLEDAGVQILLTQAKLKGLPSPSVEIWDLQDEASYQGNSLNLANINSAADLAYIIYTSGTTGRPKGVMIEHRSLVNLACWARERHQIGPDDHCSKYAGFSFDAGIQEVFSCLAAGAELHIIPGEIRLSLQAIERYFSENHITIADMPTPLAEQFIRNTANKTLRCLITGGDKLKSFSPQPYPLINEYGPTEYTVTATSYEVNENAINIPIGKPVANTRIYILNNNGLLQPVGVPGELCIAGAGLSRGYLHRPDLTAEKFKADPFCPGEKLYRTGDLARWRPDGNLEFLGRIDQQVQIRGFRVELGEIEACLMNYPGFSEAAVIVHEGQNQDQLLCAYYVLDAAVDTAADNAALSQYLGKFLPDYMIPGFFVKLERIPYTVNGKVDKRMLPPPHIETGGKKSIRPADPIQGRIAGAWEKVLGYEQAGIYDNFFRLGGHSLKAISLVGELQGEFDISVQDVFKYQDIASLAAHIRPRQGITPGIYQTLQPAPAMTDYPASSVQERLYFLYEMGNMGVSYNIPMALLIEGELDTFRLSRSLDSLIKRHESLRTSFESVDGVTVQVIHDQIRLKRVLREGREEDVPQLIKEFIHPFNLNRAPLARVEMVRLGPAKHLLLIDVHHIVFDGHSTDILMQELWALYAGEELAPLQLQYKDFAVWQQGVPDGELKTREEFWLNLFAGDTPTLNLCTDYPRPSAPSYAGGQVTFDMGSELSARLQHLAGDRSATLFTVLFCASAVLLARYTSQEDIVIGIPSAGRTAPGLEKIIGMFVNSLPVRCYPQKTITFLDLLDEVQTLLPWAYDNQDYQLDKLIEKLGISRDNSRNPLFDVMFVMHPVVETLYYSGLKIDTLEIETEIAKFDLTIEIIEGPEELSFSLSYRTDLFKDESIRRMGEHFLILLESICAYPDARLMDLQYSSEAERNKVLHEFNETFREYPADTAFQAIFEAQAELYPGKAAVVFKEQALSYAELNARANQLARRLREQGVVPDQIVGIMLEPCLEMLPGILAILKAGGAYLPIDPAYPIERIRYMLEDAGANILLTQTRLKGSITFQGKILDLQDETLYLGDSSNLRNVNSGSDMAYIIYTSGTTGKPKGVMIEHHSLVNLSLWYRDYFELTSADNCSKYAGFGFDASVWEIFPALGCGAALHVIPDEIRLSLEELDAYFTSRHITSAFLPTQMAEQFMRYKPHTSLRCLTTGGEKLKSFDRPDYRFINAYGPTEFTVVTSVFEVDRPYGNIPIGKPLANTRVYILDDNRQLQPTGLPGELCVAGAGISRGYLNRPDLTAEKFVDDPFCPGERMYRTGDLARWLPDGNLEYLGRIDQQVQVRGFRVELGEIQSQLINYPGVSDAVVVDLKDDSGNIYLCAYLVAGAIPIEPADFKDYLSGYLPAYMIPSYFIQLDRIPLTPNGKVDKKALPEPVISACPKQVPRNIVEQKIAAAWSEVLGAQVFGINDSFFDVGGNSLKAVRLVSRLQKEFEVSVNDIFKYPTIDQLASHITFITDNLRNKLKTLKQQTAEDTPPVEAFDDPALEQKLSEYRDLLAQYTVRDLHPQKAYGNIMLTGATGYLGIYLLRELLEQKSAHIYVPVRAASTEEARQRVVSKMLYYFGADLLAGNEQRVTVFNSDLSQNKLGLEDDYYDFLALTIDAIIHSAANVKHYGHFDEFYQANVQATRELLILAGAGKAKDFHHVSTVSVGEGTAENLDRVVFTEYSCDHGQRSGNVYLETKLMAEKEVLAARKQGICASVYRIGNITFDSRTGIPQENLDDNAFYQQIRAYANLGIVPQQMTKAEFSFVDQVARAIVILFDRSELRNETYHLLNSQVVELAGVLTSPELGLGVKGVSFDRFLDFLIDHMDRKEASAFIENIMLHRGWLDEQESATRCIIFSEKTESILGRLGFAWPVLDPARLQAIILRALSERLKYLHSHFLFAGLNEANLHKLGRSALLEYIAPDDYLCWENDPTEYFYLITDGFVEISRTSKSGWTGTISILREGDFVGEDSITGSEPSAITAAALFGDLQVLRFDGKDIAEAITGNPSLGLALLKAINRKVQNLEKLVVNIS